MVLLTVATNPGHHRSSGDRCKAENVPLTIWHCQLQIPDQLFLQDDPTLCVSLIIYLGLLGAAAL